MPLLEFPLSVWPCLHHLAGSGIVQGRARQKVISLIAVSSAEFSTTFTQTEVEHKGNPENSPHRNSLLCKTQVPPWHTANTLAPVASASLPSPCHLLPFPLPTGRHHDTSVPQLLALRLPALQQGGLVRGAHSGPFPMIQLEEWPTLLVPPNSPWRQ